MSSEGAVFGNDGILFATKEGLLVTIDQFIFLQEKGGLNGNQFFGQAEKLDNDVRSAWKYLLRHAGEARKDKGIDVMNLTVGALCWEMEDYGGKNKKSAVASPLFLCPVKEDGTNKNLPKISIIQPKLTVNATLARLFKAQRSVDLFRDIPTEFPFSDLTKYLGQVVSNVAGNPDAEIDCNDFHVCLLDSTNEKICQAIERRLPEIAACPLVSVFSGAEEYVPRYHGQNPAVVYPFSADDTQQEMVRRAVAGESVNGHAGPGTGKSQTCCNVIVNLLLNNKRVCVMSEKAAANEVIIDNLGKVGLDRFCLPINDKTTVKGVISKIKRSIAAPNVYVDTGDARSVIANYHEACGEIEKLNQIYEFIPELGTNLYTLFGEAIAFDDLDCAQYIGVPACNYQKARRKLEELQSQLIDTITESEWDSYLQTGSTGDEEQDEMLDEAVDGLKALGLQIGELIVDRQIIKPAIYATVISQIARVLVAKYVEEFSLGKYGNKKLKANYKKLLDTGSALEVIGAVFARQELGQRVKRYAEGSKFVELLDRLASSRITLHDFFAKYGEDVLNLCPIIVGTPNALVQYDALNSFDSLIIDESSQMPFANVLPFLTGDRQLIVFGDPQQLDITSFWSKSGIYEQQDGEEFDLSETDKSILHVVQGKLPGCQLQYHYRSKTEHLIPVSNLRCYDGLLNVAPDYYFGRENLPAELGCEIVEINDPEIGKSGANLSEARAIVDRVVKIRTEYPDKSVGIVTFNENQQSAVNDEIDRRIDEDPDLSSILYLNGDKLFLRTLENAQGKEADVILVSIGHYRRNKDGTINKQISILNAAGASNRLNVLFTRAKEKIIVAISFSYKELRDSDKGVYRLYEYLRYMATGECEGISGASNRNPDKYNEVLVKRVSAVLPGYMAYGKVGNASMTVDVGLVKDGGTHYDVGFLFPGTALSPNTVCTKVSVLERAGWRLLPLSPVTCFTKPERFAEQIRNDVCEKVRFSGGCTRTFLTETAPPELLSLQDFKAENPKLESALTEDELLRVNYFYAYENVFTDEVRSADERKTIKLFKRGNPQAKLKLYLLKLKEFAGSRRLEDLLVKVRELYGEEKSASYLYAQLLRVKADRSDAVLIDKLLAEARSIGIKVA